MWFLPEGDHCVRHTLKDGWEMDGERQDISPPSNHHLCSLLALFISLLILFIFIFLFAFFLPFCLMLFIFALEDDWQRDRRAGGGFLCTVVPVIDKQKRGSVSGVCVTAFKRNEKAIYELSLCTSASVAHSWDDKQHMGCTRHGGLW